MDFFGALSIILSRIISLQTLSKSVSPVSSDPGLCARYEREGSEEGSEEIFTTNLPEKQSSTSVNESENDGRTLENAEKAQEVDVHVQDRVETWRLILILYSLCSGLLLSMMDTSIVATSIFTIALEFDSLTGATWVILGYTLAYLGCAAIFTRISDVVGRKAGVIGAFIIFMAFSLGCGFAKSLEQLIAFRAMQGVGGSGLYALMLVILPEISPLKLLPYVSSLIGMTVAVAGCLGPVLGGIITKYSTWRWIFWLNGPCGAVPLAVFLIAWPKKVSGYELVYRHWRHTDIIGFVLLLSSSVLVVFALQEAGTGVFQWSSPVIVSTLTIGSLSWIALMTWEVFASEKYDATLAVILPLRILKSRVMVSGIVSTMCTGFAFILCIFNLPLRFQIVNFDNPATSGLHLLPLLGACAVGSCIGGLASARRNNTFGTFVFAAASILLGSGLLSTLSDSFNIEPKAYGFQVVLGFGAGMTLSSMSLMTSLEADFRDHSVAQGIVAQARVLGGSLGVAASSAIFRMQANRQLQGILSSGQIASLQTSSDILNHLNLIQLEAVREVYANSFDTSLRMCVYVAIVGLLASLGTWRANPPSIARRKAQLEEAVREMQKQQREKAEKILGQTESV